MDPKHASPRPVLARGGRARSRLALFSRDVTVRSTAQPARTDVVRLITKRKGR